MKIESYRDLIVWQRAIEMTVAVYRLTAGFPKEELYGLAVAKGGSFCREQHR
jgi:hypothetical protein